LVVIEPTRAQEKSSTRMPASGPWLIEMDGAPVRSPDDCLGWSKLPIDTNREGTVSPSADFQNSRARK
jgi:hypothetical protein